VNGDGSTRPVRTTLLWLLVEEWCRWRSSSLNFSVLGRNCSQRRCTDRAREETPACPSTGLVGSRTTPSTKRRWSSRDPTTLLGTVLLHTTTLHGWSSCRLQRPSVSESNRIALEFFDRCGVAFVRCVSPAAILSSNSEIRLIAEQCHFATIQIVGLDGAKTQTCPLTAVVADAAVAATVE
jgi:hypothetical protein